MSPVLELRRLGKVNCCDTEIRPELLVSSRPAWTVMWKFVSKERDRQTKSNILAYFPFVFWVKSLLLADSKQSLTEAFPFNFFSFSQIKNRLCQTGLAVPQQLAKKLIDAAQRCWHPSLCVPVLNVWQALCGQFPASLLTWSYGEKEKTML